MSQLDNSNDSESDIDNSMNPIEHSPEDEDQVIVDSDDDEEYEDSESSEDENLSTEERLMKAKEKLRESKKQIFSLFSNVKQYKEIMEQEKENLKNEAFNEKKELEDTVEELKNKYQQAFEFNEEIVGQNEKLRQALDEFERDRNEKNRETMKNLQSVFSELNYIEERNEELQTENEQMREMVMQTKRDLQEQNEKIENQEKELNELRRQASEPRRSSTNLQQLSSLSKGNIFEELESVKLLLQKEREKVKQIDNFLFQARQLSSGGSEGEQFSNDLLLKEQEAHKKTIQELEEERQKLKEEQIKNATLNKRLKKTKSLANMKERYQNYTHDESLPLGDSGAVPNNTPVKPSETQHKKVEFPASPEPAKLSQREKRENRKSTSFNKLFARDDSSKEAKVDPISRSLGRAEGKKNPSNPNPASNLPSLNPNNTAPRKLSKDKRKTVQISSPTSFSHIGGYAIEQLSPKVEEGSPSSSTDIPKSLLLDEANRTNSSSNLMNSFGKHSSFQNRSPSQSLIFQDFEQKPKEVIQRIDIKRSEAYKARHKGNSEIMLENIKNNLKTSLGNNDWEVKKDLEGKLFYIDQSRGIISRKSPIPKEGMTKQTQKDTLYSLFSTFGETGRKHEKEIKNIQAVVRGWLARKTTLELRQFLTHKKKLLNILLQTEGNYIKNCLNVLLDDFLKPAKAKNVLKDQPLQQILTDLTKILEGTNQMVSFFSSMIGLKNFSVVDAKTGHGFKFLLGYLASYLSFGSLYEAAMQIIQKKSFSSTISKIHSKKDVKKGVELVLLIPKLFEQVRDHLTQYEEVLENLLTHSVQYFDNENYAMLVECFHQITAANDKLLERDQIIKQENEIKRVQKVWSGTPSSVFIKGRYVVKEGPLIKLSRKETQSRYFLLFNDAFMYGVKDKKSGKVKFHQIFFLSECNCLVKDIPDNQSKRPNAFEIITSKKSFVVYADSAHEKQQWVEDFTTAVGQTAAKLSATSPNAVIKKSSKISTENLAPVWINDKDAVDCMICKKQFTMLNRRHHCRKCGKVVCGSCSEHKVTLPNIGSARVCEDCYNSGNFDKGRRTISLSHTPVERGVLKRTASMIITINTIPPSSLSYIFSFLPLADLPRVAAVCSTWKKVVDSDAVWKSHFKKRFGSYKTEAPSSISWKNKLRNDLQWGQGSYKVETIKGHTASISCLELLDPTTVLSGSLDTTIRLWNLNKKKEVQLLRGHTQTVRCIQASVSDNQIISGGEDKTIRIWGLRDCTLTKTLTQLADATSLQIDPSQSLLITGHSDGYIKLWDTRTWKNTLSHKIGGKIFDLQNRDNILVIGSSDKKIRLWDIRTHKTLSEFGDHTDVVRAVRFDDSKILSASDDSTVRVYSFTSGTNVLTAHPGAKVTCLQFDDIKLVTGSSDSSLKIWDSNNLTTPLYTIGGKSTQGEGWVRCLKFSYNTLVAGRGDNLLHINFEK